MSTQKLPLPAHLAQREPSKPSVSVEQGSRDTFLDALLEMPGTEKAARNPLKMALSVAIHVAILALLIIVPLFLAKNTISLKALQPTYVFTPPPPAPPPPPPAAKTPQTPVKVTPQIKVPTFVAPRVIPKQVETAQNNVAPPSEAPGIEGGVVGGVPGGVLGGVLGGTGAAPGPPPPASHGVVRVGGDVKAPELVQKIQPDYPPVARAARVEGKVVIDAVISKNGDVVSEKAVSGPGLLVQSALSAVKQWKYKPTYLNGEPVDLAMQVTVDFTLGS